VRDALLSLGLSPEEAREAIAGLPSDGERPVEELLRQALRSVGR
jgi:Holliday junction resolvasome RuvABC DNA-binding subunit